MIIIWGKTIAEVKRGLEMAKPAIESGMPYGIGGENIEDVEQAMGMLSAMADNAPISNPNHIAPAEVEDEDEIYCPYCGEPYTSVYCENCSCAKNECEDEEDDPCEDCEGECEGCDNYCEDGLDGHSLDGLTAEEVDHITASYGLPKAWATVMKQILGL